MDDGNTVKCILCGHAFSPGVVDGYVYCSACGRRFNPHMTGEETLLLPPPEALTSQRLITLEPETEDKPSSSTRRFGEYDIVEEIARGGMGVVYLARQRVLRRVVALKVLRSGDNASNEERERLLREAKAAAGLSHPNIVPIHEFSIHQGQPYFTMDYIEGEPLDLLLDKGPLNVRQAVEIIATVAQAISYAHARGIIHRDLKPANIIINKDGRPMITDFGLAVEMSPETEKQRRMTMAGTAMGTIPYAPPEQAAGKIDQIGERSDVYSMGAVLYEMVTGRPPFNGFTQFELMRRVINQDPVLPRQLNPKVHRDVETIILKCLEKEQRRRYDSAKAFADDCQSFLKGEVIAARPVTLGYRCRRFLARRPLLSLLGALVFLLSMVVWIVLDNFRVMAMEKQQTEQVLEIVRAEGKRIALAKEEADMQVRRDWRTEYNINFDFYFRYEYDVETSRRQGIPWLNPEIARTPPTQSPRVQLLADPPRLALTDPDGVGAGFESPLDGSVDLGLPFTFPRDVRVTMRVATPPDNVGELVLSLDVDKDYRPHLGTTTACFGSSTHPGVFFYRNGTVIGEDAAFQLRPDSTMELVLERSENRLRAFIDNRLVLETPDPPPVFNSDPGRITLDVKDGTLEFLDLAVDLRSISRNVASSLIDFANSMAAQGRPDQALWPYINVLLEPTDPQNRLRALRGYARSLWLGLPRRERSMAGIEKACRELEAQMAAAGRSYPGQTEYLIGLVMASSQSDNRLTLDQLTEAKTRAYASGVPESIEYGDLARLEEQFVYLRRNMLSEAARNFETMFEDGCITRLYQSFGSELGGGGQVALLLEKADSLVQSGEKLDTAATLLRTAAAIAPTSRECANHFRRLARVHAEQGHRDKAVDFMRWAQRLSPDWFRPYLDEANIHFDNRDPVAGREVLTRAQAAIPQSLDLHLGIAKMYLEDLPASMQDPVRAAEAAEVAARLSHNGNPSALELLARARLRLNRIDEAKTAVDAAIRVESSESRIKLREEINKRLGNGR